MKLEVFLHLLGPSIYFSYYITHGDIYGDKLAPRILIHFFRQVCADKSVPKHTKECLNRIFREG